MNYYETLGVEENATHQEIKKAYLKLSKKHHPDAGGNVEKFKEINQAYQTLKNTEQKKYYDKHGCNKPKTVSVEDFLMQIFSQILAARDFSNHNIIGHIKAEMIKDITKFKTNVAQYEHQKELLTKYRGRVTAKNGENLFSQVIDGKLSEIKNRMDADKANEIRHNEIIELLENYSDNFEDLVQLASTDGWVNYSTA